MYLPWNLIIWNSSEQHIWAILRQVLPIPISGYDRGRIQRNRCETVLTLTEPNARIAEAFRLNLQQQVVHRHLHHPLPEQEGPLRGQDQEEFAHHLLLRILRFVCLFFDRHSRAEVEPAGVLHPNYNHEHKLKVYVTKRC